MKSFSKRNIILGISLSFLSAFFLVSLLLQVMDYGTFGPGKNNFLYTLGNMLFSVYGFSSALIPLYLLLAAIFAWNSSWNARKSLILLTALIPFFTCVGAEKLCRHILNNPLEENSFIKVTLTFCVALIFILLELILTYKLADRLSSKKPVIKYDTSTNPASPLSQKTPAPVTAKDKTVTAKDKIEVTSNPSLASAPSHLASTPLKEENAPLPKEQEKEAKPKTVDEIFDDVFTQYSKSLNQELNTPASPLATPAPASPTPSDKTLPAATKESKENASTPTNKDEESKESEKEELNVSSVITEEEYASLTNFNDEYAYKDYPIESPATPSDNTAPLLQENSTSLQEKTASLVDNFNSGNDSSDNMIEWDSPEEIKQKALSSKVSATPSERANPTVEKVEEIKKVEKVEQTEKTAEPVDTSARANPTIDETNPTIDKIDTGEDKVDKADTIKKIEEVVEEMKEVAAPSQPSTPSWQENKKKLSSLSPTLAIDNSPSSFLLPPPTKEDSSGKQESSEEKTEETEPPLAPEPSVTLTAEDVFSQMEADIKKELEETPEKALDATIPLPITSEEQERQETSSKEESVKRQEAPSNKTQGMQKTNGKEEVKDEGQEGQVNDLTPDAQSTLLKAVKEDAASPAPHTLTKEEVEESKKLESTKIPSLPSSFSSAISGKKPYEVPTTLLEQYANDPYWILDSGTKQDALRLKDTLNQFNIEARIVGIRKGPVVTMFEVSPAPGVKLSKIVTLQDNIALNLAASSVRIVAPIPGKSAVGIEVPNKHRSIVGFREMIEQDLEEFNKMAIPVVLGKDILGKSQLFDLVKTPHLLIAGATGAGKSVCVNSIILSILYKRSPEMVKLILVDPKVVELKLYNDIPHLLTPVITDSKKALQSLQYCLCEMERRYSLLDSLGVRDIASYNKRVTERNITAEKLPYIVVVIDEFADLMATTGKEMEGTIARLCAMSRAVGIHLVLATQRPSIDVITGLIKANIPTRIAFMVASKMDSRIIIDQVGAEMLLGKGDMLYASAVDPFPVRIQGPYVSDQDVEKTVEYIKTLGTPEYIDDEMFIEDLDAEDTDNLDLEGPDPLYDEALEAVMQAGKASASYIQRRLKIGYNRAARLIEEMEVRGVIGPANGSKPRDILHVA